MSWDVMVFNLDGKPPPPLEQAREADFRPLGAAHQVRQDISSHLAEVDWTDASWGRYEGDGFSIEFNVGGDDPIQSAMLHVRGGGDAIAAIQQFARPLRWAVLDISTSEFLDLENPDRSGWEGFQSFRDRAIANSPADDAE